MPQLYLRLALFFVLSVPPLYWLYQAWIFALGPDPGKTILLNLGQWALALTLATLSMTPLQQLTGWRWVVFRRQLGLWAFTYAGLHLGAYLFFVLGFDFAQLGIEIQNRPYILVGSIAFVCLAALGSTSNKYAIRKLGRRWKELHKTIYVAGTLALLHMLWIVRSDLAEWVLYASVFTFLMVLRIPVISRVLKVVGGHFRNRKENVI
jgi:sulfoxide reductase heme-binding subunit YedZ